jgi:hypothetical protein
MPLLIWPMEICVRRIVRARGEPAAWLGLCGALRMYTAIIVTQIVYAAALVSALSARVVLWRGVSYRVDGPWKIRLLEDRPYEPGPSAADANASL